MSEEANLGEAVLRISTDGNGLRLGIEEAQVAAMGMQKNLDSAHNHIKDRFAEKFEHIGVHTFGHQMLGMIGITEGARPILGALKLGVNQLAEAFGLAGGPIGLAVFGLAAVAAIGVKVYEGHEKHAQALEALIKKQDEELKKTIEIKDKLEEYEKVLGHLPPKLDAFRDATDRLFEVQVRQTSHEAGKAMSASLAKSAALQKEKEQLESMLKTQIASVTMGLSAEAAIRAENHARNSFSEKLTEISDKMVAEHAHYETLKTDVAAHKAGAESQIALLGKQAKALEELAKKRKDDQDHAEKATATLARMGAITKEIDQDGAAATTNAYAKRRAEIEKYRIAKQFEIDRMRAEVLANARTQDQILAANRQHAAASAALFDAVAKKNFENFGRIGTAAVSLGKTIENSFASSAAKAVTQSKSMHDAWISISQQIKEQIVADGIKMGIEYVAQAAKGIVMHQSIATAASASATAQVSANVAVIASTKAKTASVAELTAALVAAATAATALDIALAAAV